MGPMAPRKPAPVKTIPIQKTELSTFDDSFSFLKEKFQAEMQRMDEEMNRFTRTLKSLYGLSDASAVTAAAAITGSSATPTWESLNESPLIQGEGDDKMLNLQFDLSSFEPDHIKVEIQTNTLKITARREETSDSGVIIHDFTREFMLPRGTDPNSINSSLSRDGVLTVTATLPILGPETATSPTAPARANRRRSSITDPKIAPGAPPGNLVPQSPLSSASPASPHSLGIVPESAIGSERTTTPQVMSPQKASKQSSAINKPAAK